MSEDFFAPPPFKPEAALAGLKRELRALRLAEREGRFELQGRPVAALAIEDETIAARMAKRPSQSPEWTASTLKNATDVRRFTEELKSRLARWSDRDD